MSSITHTLATLDDLYRIYGKAELIAGRIVHFMATGRKPSKVAARIFRSLDDFAESTDRGEAYTDKIGYTVPILSSGRESFSPDASYFPGPFPSNPMRFLEGPPLFAVEVRSENDYGVSAEATLAAKRDDYFEARTIVVWDVDPINNQIFKYTATAPAHPTVFTAGQAANAEPPLQHWQINVDQIFR